MKAKIAFLTSPAPHVYLFNYQEDGKEGLCQVEISEGHLANIVIDGASYALRRSTHRVQIHTTSAENAGHERSTAG